MRLLFVVHTQAPAHLSSSRRSVRSLAYLKRTTDLTSQNYVFRVIAQECSVQLNSR